MASRRDVLFFTKTPMNWIVFAGVARLLMQDDRIRFFVRAETEEARPVEEIYEPLGVPRRAFVSYLRARWTPWDMYLSPDMRIAGKRARRKVHLFHGISFKGKAYTPQVRDYDHAFLIGPYQRSQFVKRGILPENDPRMMNIGMPKTDSIVHPPSTREETLARIGADPSLPTVLYAPTWRKESSLNVMGAEILAALGTIKANVLVKVHDLCLNPATNSRDWGAWLAAQEAAGAPWRWVREPDISPWLAVADLLVSDASSTANEFLLRDRPVVFMDVPALFDHYADTLDLDTWGRRTGVVVANPAELPDAVRHQLQHPADHSTIRRAACADYFYNPGNATQASCRAILELLDLSPR